MIRHIFLDKCNTIIENSEVNTGLNPVGELNVGKFISRMLIHFNIDLLKEDFNDNIINLDGIKHILKMKNCGNINLPTFNDEIYNEYDKKTRASSFDIVAYKVPFEWDGGRGFDYHGDYIKESNKIVSKDGSNWYNYTNGKEWSDAGIYDIEVLKNEYLGITNNGLIVAKQHFDTGIEDLELDITDYVNLLIKGEEKNNGLCISFSPIYETTTLENKFISFFTNHTNTFFNPYLEVINNNPIVDNRFNFHLGVKNKLYFFASDNGEFINLDEKPVCNIDGVEYEVKQQGRGVYYVELCIKKGEIEPDTILYDVWSNIRYNGELLDDIEMEFVVLPLEKRIMLGKNNNSNFSFYPQLSGINEKENIKIGDIRKIVVDFIEEYSYGKKITPNFAEFRLYVKEGDREIDVFPFHSIERLFDEHMFIINTNDLIPNKYYIDIRIKNNGTVKIFDKVLEFNLVDNITRYKI